MPLQAARSASACGASPRRSLGNNSRRRPSSEQAGGGHLARPARRPKSKVVPLALARARNPHQSGERMGVGYTSGKCQRPPGRP